MVDTLSYCGTSSCFTTVLLRVAVSMMFVEILFNKSAISFQLVSSATIISGPLLVALIQLCHCEAIQSFLVP